MTSEISGHDVNRLASFTEGAPAISAAESPSKKSDFLSRAKWFSDRARRKLELQIAQLEHVVDETLAESLAASDYESAPSKPEQICIWGVPFSYLSLADTIRHIDRLIALGDPGYFITANLNYNMLTDQCPELQAVNDNANFIVCDGMPMVKYSKWLGKPLPQRVAGSELIYALTKLAAIKGYRIFFLGGAPGVAQEAADKLAARYPGLQIAGIESPPFRPLTEKEQGELVQRIRVARPDIVYVAFGQPKGELWIAQHYQEIGAPACVQLGASFDFVAGGVARAPMWVQQIGMEWFYRLIQEPRRLAGRYLRNGLFLLRSVSRDLARLS